jgi:hypothetical protein
MTSVFIKVTWHVVGITLVSLGGLLVLFAGRASTMRKLSRSAASG